MTKKTHEAGIWAARTRRIREAFERAHGAERASKRALSDTAGYAQESPEFSGPAAEFLE
jgi:hypothetical protein